MPVTSAPSKTYGDRAASERAQRAVPVGTPEVAAAPSGWHPSQGRPADMPAPGSMGDLFADSADPDEHVMAGAALGPGPGPEAFGADPESERRADLESVAIYTPMLLDWASRGGSSTTTRQYIRMLLGNG